MKTFPVMVRLNTEQLNALDIEVERLKKDSPETLRITRSHVMRLALGELVKKRARQGK